MRMTLICLSMLSVSVVPPTFALTARQSAKSEYPTQFAQIDPGKPGGPRLYNRLGGKKTIQAIVSEFVDIVAADRRINRFFADMAKDPKRVAVFRNNLVDQICQATGGPCKYKGKDMKAAHKGMGITGSDFNALVEDLVRALDKFHVGATEKNELLSALGGMKGDIVGQ